MKKPIEVKKKLKKVTEYTACFVVFVCSCREVGAPMVFVRCNDRNKCEI